MYICDWFLIALFFLLSMININFYVHLEEVCIEKSLEEQLQLLGASWFCLYQS